MGIFNKIFQSIKERLEKLSGGQRRQLVLACTAFFIAVLTLSVIISVNKPQRNIQPSGMEAMRFIYAIPAEELFLPDEPDFLPGVILERERRTSWTEDDAAEYWQDPLKNGEQQWRDKMEAAVDEFLERIP
ncbi:MAG: hypothetical protein FWB89_02185 [Treponema sp.]|nr:hypothetical protein [Treponema sp.]